MLLGNLLFKHDVWHLYKCSGMSISELLRWCDSPRSCKQGFFFLPPLDTIHPRSLFSQKHSCLVGQWHSEASFALLLPYQNCLYHVPGSWSWRWESLRHQCLTQLSTWVKWDVVLTGSPEKTARQRRNYFLMVSQKIFALTLMSCSGKVT